MNIYIYYTYSYLYAHICIIQQHAGIYIYTVNTITYNIQTDFKNHFCCAKHLAAVAHEEFAQT